MKFGLLDYEEAPTGLFNIGDHIQSLAARQYLPRVDRFVLRDRLNESLPTPTKVIMNGWYTHKPENWPPTSNLLPFFVSFHLNQAYAEAFLSKPENVTYLKKHGPIGCRDYTTLNFLQNAGIDAYYSFCLTTTLDLKYKIKNESERSNEILMVDVLFKENYNDAYKSTPTMRFRHMLNGKYFKKGDWKKKINRLIPKFVLEEAQSVTHVFQKNEIKREDRFAHAEKLLNRYARAKLVITSRIHCALPCLALGTPVVFIHGGGLNHANEIARLSGTIDHLNVLLDDTEIIAPETYSSYPNLLLPEKIDWNNIVNPSGSKILIDELKTRCFQFIEQ